MTATSLALAVVVAVVAAARSTWSPCGASMLSALTPLSERGRHHRWGATATWFVLGAALGGLTLGAAAAGLAAVVAAAGPGATATLGAVAVAALVAAASDARLGGFRLPGHTRQVNEWWFGAYRPWVYATGFGWQIGVGLATYIRTAAVHLLVVVAALTASPALALALCGLFGLVRGLAVLAGWRLTTPAALASFHRRFDALEGPTRWATACALAAVAVVAATAAWGPWASAGAGALVVAAGAWQALAASSPPQGPGRGRLVPALLRAPSRPGRR